LAACPQLKSIEYRITRQQKLLLAFFVFFACLRTFHAVVDDDGTTAKRRVCRLYAGCFYDGRGGRAAGADAEFVSQPRSGAQPFWVGLFYTVNAIAGILVSLALAKRSDSRGDRRRLIMFAA
jgi:hypothetical protein